MNLSEPSKLKISLKVLDDIIDVCESEDIKFVDLDENMRNAIIKVFQLGVGYIQKIIDDIKNDKK